MSQNDCVDIQLAYSGDTINWNRIAPGKHFIPRGRGTYPDGDYLRIYYKGGYGYPAHSPGLMAQVQYIAVRLLCYHCKKAGLDSDSNRQ